MTRTYQAELRQLVAEVIRMGGLAEAQVVDAVDAVVRRDVPLAQALIVRDLRLDTLQSEVERRALDLIATHQPGHADLRRAISTLKLAMNLERCGDLARNIAKRSLVLSASEPLLPLTGAIERMGRLVSARLREVLDAYAAGDVEPALDVWRRDGEVDEHYESLFRELLSLMTNHPGSVAAGAHLLFIAKNLERIGDHATNIAEILHFQMTGQELIGERPKVSLPNIEVEGVQP
ncbi:MAG: phosphate transport system regulatory protein PhoU [Phenylobacterium sp. RIFCSPHIGHO2_01_FULL_69_31]|uniref:phosphate signaling complex protein PhoU n=1 Tax=unclassified Phenylobacterium TaxID=2640670 RepID=UPI00083B6746|nr:MULTISPECIES: phosphate signaling complex protein PhoU [unclassified Phenylobacterium]OHB26718.1 MAG: phosphate transport system regulatory protein PhoU [Phenylobacterium sp. RIFCSPHIGHO2_01_FULL_69_31]